MFINHMKNLPVVHALQILPAYSWEQLIYSRTSNIVSTIYVVCPKSSCSGLAEEWDVNWWRTHPALFSQQDPVDVQ
jgi:hypothetical protein